jgi:hypothetical protein
MECVNPCLGSFFIKLPESQLKPSIFIVITISKGPLNVHTFACTSGGGRFSLLYTS